MSRTQIILSAAERDRIFAWLKTRRTTQAQWEHSYPTWGRVGNAWDRSLATGSTYTLRAIVWYQHEHKPGSRESRPSIVLPAIVAHLDSIGFTAPSFG